MNYQLTTLPNGLRIATEFIPGVETVSITISAGVGARYESEKENGISHLLEHMAFKGTATRNAMEIAETFDNIGGQFNAFTSMELTVYFAKTLKNHVPLVIDIMADILKNSVFDEEELAKEKEVIIQEIAMHQDSPDDLIIDIFDETAFPDQPIGRSIISTPERVSAHTRDDIINYMKRHYVPSNLVISAAGNIEHETFVALVSAALGEQPAGQATIAPIAHYVGGDKRVESNLEQLQLAIGFPALTMFDPNYYGMQLYANILGGGMSSRLFQEVREKRGLVYSIGAMANAYVDTGVMGIFASSTPNKGEELTLTLVDEVNKMTNGISNQELERGKNQLKAELIMSRESPQNVANVIGRHLLLHGEYKKIPDITARIDAVTKDDVMAFAELVKNGKPTLAALGENIETIPAVTN